VSLRTLTCLVLFLATHVVFWQVGDHDFLIYDDPGFVTNNPYVKSGFTPRSVMWAFSTNETGNWHPLTWFSHMLDVQIFGINAKWHHLVNLLFHAINGVLLFLLLTALTGSNWQSAFVAAMFALHPLHVESVAWVAERKDVLSGMFWMLTLLLYSRYVQRPGPLRYMLTLGAFALGLMAKPMLVTIPVVLFLLDYWPLRRISFARTETRPIEAQQPALGPTSDRGLIAEKIPFLLLAFASAGITFLAQQGAGTVPGITGTPVGFRIINALSAYVAYIGKMLWPQDLAVIYSLPPTLTLLQGEIAGALLLAISVAAVQLRRRHPYFVIGWLWYLVTLLPVIGLVQVGKQSMADRYTYIPLIGLLIAIAWGATAAVHRIDAGRAVLRIAAAVVILACAVLTWLQLSHWRNSESLFRHAAQAVDDNYVAHGVLGNLLAGQGRLEEAPLQYRAALRILPDDETALAGMGRVLGMQGKLDDSAEHFRALLQISPEDAEGHYNLGIILARQGKIGESIEHFHEALRLRPDFAEARRSLDLATRLLEQPAGQ
jgi:Tfp pilus assembly protein PilF